MSQLIPFQFHDSLVRVHLDEKGTPWWEAQDVCAILGIKDVSQAVSRLELGEKREIILPTETRNPLIINESGLYRLIFRSNKPEARAFQNWVFNEVLPQIRKTGSYIPVSVPPPLLPSPAESLAVLREFVNFAEELGLLTERDKLMAVDAARNAVFAGDQRLLGHGADSRYGFSLAERVKALGYQLSRKAEASIFPTLGKRIAAEYRRRYKTHKVPKETRYVDGAQRPVAWYGSEDASWIDPMIQGYLAQLPGIEVR